MRKIITIVVIFIILIGGLGYYYQSSKTIYVDTFLPYGTNSSFVVDVDEGYIILLARNSNETIPQFSIDKNRDEFSIDHFTFSIEIIEEFPNNTTEETKESFNILYGRYIQIILTPSISFHQRRDSPEYK